MICRVQVKKYWIYKLFYTILTLFVILIPIMFAIDPLCLASSIDTKSSYQEQEYALDAALGTITVNGPLGLVAGQESTIFNASVNQEFNPDIPATPQSCLYFGTNEAFYATKTNNIIQKLGIKKDGTFYKSGDFNINCIDIASIDNLNSAQTTGTALIAVAIIILIVMVLFVWLTCEGWCRCNSPIRSETTLSSGQFV